MQLWLQPFHPTFECDHSEQPKTLFALDMIGQRFVPTGLFEALGSFRGANPLGPCAQQAHAKIHPSLQWLTVTMRKSFYVLLKFVRIIIPRVHVKETVST